MSSPIVPVPVPIAPLDESGNVRGLGDLSDTGAEDRTSVDEPAPDESEEHLSRLAIAPDPLPDILKTKPTVGGS